MKNPTYREMMEHAAEWQKLGWPQPAIGRYKDAADRLMKLEKEVGRLTAWMFDISGYDCSSYEEFMKPAPCGNCPACAASSALAGLHCSKSIRSPTSQTTEGLPK